MSYFLKIAVLLEIVGQFCQQSAVDDDSTKYSSNTNKTFFTFTKCTVMKLSQVMLWFNQV